MKLITDVRKNRKTIKNSIRRHGFSVEHNYHHFLNSETKYDRTFFFKFNGTGIMSKLYKNREWHMFSEVLAPESKRMDLFLKFLDCSLKDKQHKKVVVETTRDFRKKIIENINKDKYYVRNVNYALEWPIFNMKEWDHRLKGKEFKKLRNIRNRLKRSYNIRVVDSRNVKKEKLKKLVDDWVRNRPANDEVEKQEYYNIIDNNFKGFDIARTILINNEPCTITAGWGIVNSKKKYYSAIGIYNYKYPGIGEYANLDDLINLKKKKYEYVDFGGSDKILYRFKKKFGPHQSYKTYIFSIVRKNEE